MDPTDTVTFSLTDAETRAVLYACSLANRRPELWGGNASHLLQSIGAREKMKAAYEAQLTYPSDRTPERR